MKHGLFNQKKEEQNKSQPSVITKEGEGKKRENYQTKISFLESQELTTGIPHNSFKAPKPRRP